MAEARNIPLERKVEWLQRPTLYPDHATEVEVVETHLSFVFLTRKEVYKFKKPVLRPPVDFSTLPLRRRHCESELILNRRLAPSVYLGVLPLTLAADGTPSLGGDGEVVEWLVRMRRLPADDMLDARIRAGAVTRAALDEIGTTLARFYCAAPRADFAAQQYPARIAAQISAASAVLRDPTLELEDRRTDDLVKRLLRCLDAFRSGLMGRVQEGWIVEGHGDLRPEHICLTSPPLIIDCLEFSRSLRLLDPLDELAFLRLECAMLGAESVGERILEAYRGASGDEGAASLFDFYAAVRCLIRSKLSLWHLLDCAPSSFEIWRQKARRYLDEMARYLGRLTVS